MNKVLIYDKIKSIEVNNKIFNNFKNSNDLKIVQNEINKYYIESGFEDCPYIEIVLTSNQNKKAENIIINSGEYGDSSMGWDIENNTLDKYLIDELFCRFNALYEHNKDFDVLPLKMDRYEFSARLDDINCQYSQGKDEIMEYIESVLISENDIEENNILIKLNYYQYADDRVPNIDLKIEQYVESDIINIVKNILNNKIDILKNDINIKLIKYLLQERYSIQNDNCNYIYTINKMVSGDIDYLKALRELKDYDLTEQYIHLDKYIKKLTNSNINLDLQTFLTLKLNSLNNTIQNMSKKYE